MMCAKTVRASWLSNRNVAAHLCRDNSSGEEKPTAAHYGQILVQLESEVVS
jgi:hypothetical protein